MLIFKHFLQCVLLFFCKGPLIVEGRPSNGMSCSIFSPFSCFSLDSSNIFFPCLFLLFILIILLYLFVYLLWLFICFVVIHLTLGLSFKWHVVCLIGMKVVIVVMVVCLVSILRLFLLCLRLSIFSGHC